ncbi:MAG: hypothetical protein OJF49_004136 [Ktedonobacterales bacterium]|jgi:glycosyltransferase involved in cell wall biosynthesis|nr:MAG: hypothetical protein OJF49_004136 [Ktedonobacterales bacterium]
MRVAFNALFLQEPRTGTGRYTYNLLQSLGRVDGVNEYEVLSPRTPEVAPETPSSFHWDTPPVGKLNRGGENIEKVVWEQRGFPMAAKRSGARVMHVPHFAPPLRAYGIPVIVTVHDVINLRLPLYRASPQARVYSRFVTWGAKRATLLVAVSEHAKCDIIELLGVSEERIRVIREAPAGQYRPVQDATRLREVREKYDLGERYVLNVGGLDQRKNIAGLIGAFAAVYHEIGDADLQLFIAGNQKLLGSGPLFPDWRPLAVTFGVANQIRCEPVDEADLPALYSGAACFAFTSLYEGFGLTPLEAMACGTPVVCSDRTSLPEVVGSAGLLADPADVDGFSAAMLRVLTSAETYADLRARGLARVKQFNWDQVAVETSALYAEVTGTKRD